MSSICAKASVKLKQVEQENRDAMFVFLSDVWLDQVKVSQIGSREWKSYTCINDILYMYIYILDCPRVELYALSELYRITCVYLLNPFTICTFYSFQGENDFWKSHNAFIIYEYVFIDVKPLFIIFILIFCTLNLKSVNYEQYHIWVEITYRSNLTGTNMTWKG